MHPENLGVVVINGQKINTPRWQQSYGRSYAFTGMVHHALPLDTHPYLIKLQKYIFEYTSYPYFQVLINWYANGKHRIGWHSDDESQLMSPLMTLPNKETTATTSLETTMTSSSATPLFAARHLVDEHIGVWSFSFGARRRFDVRRKGRWTAVAATAAAKIYGNISGTTQQRRHHRDAAAAAAVLASSNGGATENIIAATSATVNDAAADDYDVEERAQEGMCPTELKLELINNSCVFMGGRMQAYYHHQVPAVALSRCASQRLNITLRLFKQDCVPYLQCIRQQLACCLPFSSSTIICHHHVFDYLFGHHYHPQTSR